MKQNRQVKFATIWMVMQKYSQNVKELQLIGPKNPALPLKKGRDVGRAT